VFGVEPSNVAFLRTDSELLVGVLLYVFHATIEGRIPLLTINPEETWHCAAHDPVEPIVVKAKPNHTSDEGNRDGDGYSPPHDASRHPAERKTVKFLTLPPIT